MSIYRCPNCSTKLDEFGICIKCEIIWDLDDLESETTIQEDYELWKEVESIINLNKEPQKFCNLDDDFFKLLKP